jgi:hypothetical protein
VAVGNASFQQVIKSFDRWHCFTGLFLRNEEILTQDKGLEALLFGGLLKRFTSLLKCLEMQLHSFVILPRIKPFYLALKSNLAFPSATCI